MNSETVLAVLSSSFLTALLTSVASVLIQTYLRKIDYEDEYYKQVIGKRLKVYEFIEKQIALLKSSVLDNDKQMYHTIFAFSEKEYYEFQQNLFASVSNNMWISDETSRRLIKLNRLLLNIGKDFEFDGLKEVGKAHYKEIALLRDEIEKLYRKDMLELHKVRPFLERRASSEPVFQSVDEVFGPDSIE